MRNLGREGRDFPVKSSSSVAATARWRPPEENVIKLNTDGAIDISKGCASPGIVVRDHLGRLIACRCIQYVGISEPFVAELLACRDAILLAIEKGWSSIVLETDCQLIVRDWIEGNDRSAGGHIYREMKSYLSNFQGFDLKFVGRGANVAAHSCARQAISLDVPLVTFVVVPDFLSAGLHSVFVRVPVE